MTKIQSRLPSRFTLLKLTSCLALLAAGSLVSAGELYKLRQLPIGSFGGEIATKADNPGFFGTVVFTHVEIDNIKDANGDDITLNAVPGGVIPLPTKTRGIPIPDGTYKLNLVPATVDFNQKMDVVNLVGGYLTETEYNGGRVAFAVNLPLMKVTRSFIATQPLGTVSPTPGAPLPAQLQAAINQLAAGVNVQVQAGVAASSVSQNQDVTGIGDTEMSMVWIRHKDNMKIAAGMSVYVPTGKYDKNRGPNPGYGDFYTIRPGVAVTYALNPDNASNTWDSGVTLAARIAYGMNTKNKDTDYKSGNFMYGEAAVVKVSGNWAIGSNLFLIQQVSDDSGTGVPADGARYKNMGIGPFMSFKLPGQDAGFNLGYTRNFGSRNALVASAIQMRFIKAW
jgi:hypothetical protein